MSVTACKLYIVNAMEITVKSLSQDNNIKSNVFQTVKQVKQNADTASQNQYPNTFHSLTHVSIMFMWKLKPTLRPR